jgi:hypothetical protein
LIESVAKICVPYVNFWKMDVSSIHLLFS